MSKKRHTVALEKDGQRYKLFKVWFGADGSYYVTVPYHTAKTAHLWKRTVPYDTPFGKEFTASVKEVVDVATLDDDEGRIKLSHHPDGFCQFSGHGILSGIDKNGQIKGIGVFARALKAIGPKFGPVFIVLSYGIENFDVCSNIEQDDVLFRQDYLAPDAITSTLSESGGKEPANNLPWSEGISIEGFYFQPEFRRFINRSTDGSMKILMTHPTGIVIPFTVVLSPVECDLPGFLGLYACRQMVQYETDSGFVINGPAENCRIDTFGRPIGDVISCHYPRMTSVEGRAINYPPVSQEEDLADKNKSEL